MEQIIIDSMQKVCEAASDFSLGLSDKDFAKKNGGTINLREVLRMATYNYEQTVLENEKDMC